MFISVMFFAGSGFGAALIVTLVCIGAVLTGNPELSANTGCTVGKIA